MSVFLPIKLPAAATPLFATLPNQMSPLHAKPGDGYSLGELSDMIYQQMGTAAVLGDHAIPSIGAYVEYMAATVLSAVPNPHYLCAWHGVLAMMALSRLYNFNIHIDAHNLPGANPAAARTPLSGVYKQELRRLGLLDGNQYYVVMRDNYPLAVLHPRILICPFKNIDSRAVENVPWVSRGSNGEWHWEEIAPCAGPGQPQPAGNPTQVEKFMLCAWLQEQANAAKTQSNPAVADALDAWQSRLANGQPILPLTNYPNGVLTGCAAVAGKSLGALNVNTCITVPDFRITVDVPQLTDKLLFANENISSMAGANGWDLRIDAGAPGGNTVVPPITAEFARMLADYRKAADNEGKARPDLELLDVRIERDDFVVSGAVTVQIRVRNDALEMVQTKTYQGQDLVYVNNFPYVCMWPYIYLVPDEWKDYYVSMVPVPNPAPKPAGLCQEIDAGKGMLDFAMPTEQVHDIKSRDKLGFTFKVLQSEQFPWFVPLSYTDSLGQRYQGGCLLSRPSGNIIPAGVSTAKATIDFGTSNSVCAVRCAAKTFYDVLDGSLIRAMVNVKSGNGEASVESFHRYYGISTSTKNGKFASVAELYSSANNRPFIDGQILLTESGIIDYFTAQDTNLQAIGIFSNLKRDKAAPDLAVNHAIEIFVTQLTLLCALTAKRNGCSSINFCFSYPNEAYRSVLQSIWSTAINHLSSRRIFLGITAQCITEYNAAAQYVLNSGPLLSAAIPEAGFAVVDIGGGTSDMTVWQKPANVPGAPVQKLGSLSFQYAGNQIFSHSFFVYFKHNPEQLKSILPQIFGFTTLVDAMPAPHATPAAKAKVLNDNKAKKAIRNYIDAISDVTNVNDPAKFPALTALLNTLLEEPGIDSVFWNSPSCDDLRSLVSFKLKGVLFVLANLIWECNGINTDAGPYRIYLVGGGSQAFKLPQDASAHLFQVSTRTMLTALTAITPAPGKNPFDITTPDIALAKTEVVNGALFCMTTPDLQPLLQNVAAPAPGGPGGPAAPPVVVENLMKKLETLYRAFIEFAVKQDGSLQELLPKLELPRDQEPSDAQKAVWDSFNGGALNVWNKVDQNLDRNISERTRLSAFAVRMAEELLNQ